MTASTTTRVPDFDFWTSLIVPGVAAVALAVNWAPSELLLEPPQPHKVAARTNPTRRKTDVKDVRADLMTRLPGLAPLRRRVCGAPAIPGGRWGGLGGWRGRFGTACPPATSPGWSPKPNRTRPRRSRRRRC